MSLSRSRITIAVLIQDEKREEWNWADARSLQNVSVLNTVCGDAISDTVSRDTTEIDGRPNDLLSRPRICELKVQTDIN